MISQSFQLCFVMQWHMVRAAQNDSHGLRLTLSFSWVEGNMHTNCFFKVQRIPPKIHSNTFFTFALFYLLYDWYSVYFRIPVNVQVKTVCCFKGCTDIDFYSWYQNTKILGTPKSRAGWVGEGRVDQTVANKLPHTDKSICLMMV